MAKKIEVLSIIILIVELAWTGQSQLMEENLPTSVISDGVHGVQEQPFVHQSNLILFDQRSCDQTYGFLPCTTTFLGNIFLILAYGYLMFSASKFLSDGSETLRQILGPGIVGAFFLPLLSSLPNAAIVLASGLSGSKETAQNQVSIGIGLMAGSTVTFLTLLWGSCLIAGKCDIEGSETVDFKDTRRLSLTGSGVTTDIWTCYAARIMLISIIPWIIVQLPQVFHTNSQTQLAILVSLIVSICFLFCDIVCQVLQPWIQKRSIAYANYKHVESEAMEHPNIQTLGKLFSFDGQPNEDAIQKLFETLDTNSDGYLTAAELRAFVIGIQLEELDMDIDDVVDEVFKDLDTSGDSRLDFDEFNHGISNWLAKARQSAIPSNGQTTNANSHQQKGNENDMLGDQNDELKWNATKAVLVLLLGAIVAAVLADPLVDAVDNFSSASSIPSFFVSFVILPFASSSNMVSDLVLESRNKSSKSASLAYTQIYESVTMNNVFCLSIFLGLVYFQDLTWNFSPGVMVILLVCIAMGLISSFGTTFPLWLSFLAYALYPLSLLLAYEFDYVFG